MEAKRSAWEATGRGAAHAQETLRSSLFAGAFFAPKTRRTVEKVPLTEHIQGEDSAQFGRGGVALHARELAGRHRFLHWHLGFAEIMQDGGFDAVLGNPPWKVSQLNEIQYFSSRSPRIAALAGAERKEAISELKQSNPELWEGYRKARRGLEAWNHYCRASGRYSLGNHGKLNSYALFAETCLQVIKPKGRAGLIVPTGIATDHSTRRFFEHIATSRRLATLYDFENRDKVFPGIDSRIKFCLLTIAGRNDPVPEPEFACFLRQVEQLRERERRFTLSREDFKLFKPNTRTAPMFRTRHDMEIAGRMYRRAGVFWREKRGHEPEENPWGISLQQMFNMTDDSDDFRTREQLEDEGLELRGNEFVSEDEAVRYLPLYEAKVFHQYDHRFGTFDVGFGEGHPQWQRPTDNGRNKGRSGSRGHSEVLGAGIGSRSTTRKVRDRSIVGRRDGRKDSSRSRDRLSNCSPKDHGSDERKDERLRRDREPGPWRFGNDNCVRDRGVVFRDIAAPTSRTTAILPATRSRREQPGFACQRRSSRMA